MPGLSALATRQSRRCKLFAGGRSQGTSGRETTPIFGNDVIMRTSHLVQVLRRHGEEPDLPGPGPADPRAFEGGGRGDLGQGHRLPRPQRSQEDQQAVRR
jgi:hypothetical protein